MRSVGGLVLLIVGGSLVGYGLLGLGLTGLYLVTGRLYRVASELGGNGTGSPMHHFIGFCIGAFGKYGLAGGIGLVLARSGLRRMRPPSQGSEIDSLDG